MTEFSVFLVIVLVIVLGVGVWLLAATRRELHQLRQSGGPNDAAAQMLQIQVETVRNEAREGQEGLRREMVNLQKAVSAELKGVGGEVTRQLQESMKLIQQAQTIMGDRLDNATRVVGEVRGSLGRLGEATQRVVEVGKEIQGLEHVLKSPKVRGGLGETLLEQLLAQMLPRGYYEIQHAFRSGEKVDAAILIGDHYVPVDAKLPLGNFRRMLAESDEEGRRAARKQFARDAKARVDEIARKYILPDEGTFDFALMYVPTENVYYEIVIKDEADGSDESVADYALAKRVVPVSPNSLFAYIQVIILGLHGLRIEANAREIQADLARLAGDLEKVREPLRKLGQHLGNAQNQFADAERALDRFGGKLEAIERKGEQAAFPEAGG